MRERAILEALEMCRLLRTFRKKSEFGKGLGQPNKKITRQRLDKIREHSAKNLSRW